MTTGAILFHQTQIEQLTSICSSTFLILLVCRLRTMPLVASSAPLLIRDDRSEGYVGILKQQYVFVWAWQIRKIKRVGIILFREYKSKEDRHERITLQGRSANWPRPFSPLNHFINTADLLDRTIRRKATSMFPSFRLCQRKRFTRKAGDSQTHLGCSL